MNREKGIGLILAVFFIVITAFIAVIAFSILSSGSTSGLTNIMSTRAYGIAYGGMEWYLEQLKDDTDWTTNEATLIGNSLGSGTFDITINNFSSTEVSFTVTGSVPGYEGQNIQQKMNITAKKLPQAALFAIYWGRHEAHDVEFKGNMSVSGDYWSAGTTEVESGSSITNGKAYYGTGEDIEGAGSFSKQQISSPPSMPQINQIYYDGLISAYNTKIDAASGGDYNLSANLDLAGIPGKTINCRDFNTNGTITIFGNGYIVATRDILLHTENGDFGTLTITPSGGNIYFLADNDLTVDSTKSDTYVNMNSGVVLYSRGTSNTLTIRNDNTSIDGAFIMAINKLEVKDSADLTNCTLYVPDNDSNSTLKITDSGTTITTSSILSLSPANKGLEIQDATISGLVYHYGSTDGDTAITDATISGSVICSYFNNHKIDSSTITHDLSSLPSTLPQGFNGYVIKDAESWDDQ